MHQNKILNKLILIITSIQTFLMSILFIIQILRIYYGNNATFTKEICGKYIMQILPVIIIWIVVVIASFVISYITKNPDKNVAKITNIVKLKNLERICPKYESGELKKEYAKLSYEKDKRTGVKVITLALITISSFMGLAYLVNVKHFASDGDLTEQAIQMSVHLMPWVIISFVSLIISTLYEEYSAKTSIEIIKVIIKSKGKKVVKTKEDLKKRKIMNIARCAVLLLAIVLIVHGISNGGASDVLQKAVNICTECIGLG